MNPKNHKKNKQHAFDCFCKKVLRNDVRNYYSEMKRIRKFEISFSELTAREIGQLFTTDRYFQTEHTFDVRGHDIIVRDESIAEALCCLTELKRNTILLSYFLELSDKEVGKRLNLKRSTTQYNRSRALEELRRILEDESANE